MSAEPVPPPPGTTSVQGASARLGIALDDLLEALLGNVADAFYVVDHHGDVAFANPAAVRILGYARDTDLLGRNSHATIHHSYPDGSHFPAEDCPMLRPRTTGETVHVDEDWFFRPDGTMFPVAYSSAPLPTDDGFAAVIAFRDISSRREAEDAQRREAVERARAEELHASRARIVAAADEERRRLERDLHDGAQQRLLHVVLLLQLLARKVSEDDSHAQDLLRQVVEEARGAITDLRDLSSGIHSSVLTNRGLEAAVESLTHRVPVPVEIDVAERRYPAHVETTAYYLIAEALANVTKHAEATEARVTVREEHDRLMVEIADDGRGGAEAHGGGTGLPGLADRVAALDGDFEVVSPPGGGTVVRARLGW